MIVGATARGPQMQAGHAVLAVVHDEVVAGEPFPEYPNRRAMAREMSAVLGAGKGLPGVGLNRLIMAASLAVQDLLAPVGACIVSGIGGLATRSKFFVELDLRQVPLDQREFLREFGQTQMFQAHVEQERRKQSDHLSPQRPSILAEAGTASLGMVP
jgi:hypothetical protein